MRLNLHNRTPFSKGMALPQIEFNDIKPGIKNYHVSGIVIERAMPHFLGRTSTICQRIVFQNSKGHKLQAAIYHPNIDILEKTLKLYHCYCITNAPVGTIPELYRYLEIPYQLNLSAKTPIEEIQIDGLTMRSLKYNFTELADLESVTETGPKIDVLFAILQVGLRRKPKNAWLADVQVIDQSLQPRTITLWDQFSEVEATAMANLPGAFPIAIGLHLRISTFYGTGLGTHNSTIFIFNPPIPQATTLQAWCLANTERIKALPVAAMGKMPIAKSTPPSADQIVKIINLPSLVDKPEFHSIEGVIRVANLSQKFYYLVCSICNNSTSAYGSTEFACNYCNKKVLALPKLKFKVQISDLSDSVKATVFAAVSEQFYGLTGKDVDTTNMDGSLPMSILEKLSTPRNCSVHLKAEMNNYRGINECKFLVQAIFDSNPIQDSTGSKHTLILGPLTPNKKNKNKASTAEDSNTDYHTTSPESDAEMNTDNTPPTKAKED